MNLTRDQLEQTVAFLEKQRDAKARQSAALTCLKDWSASIVSRLFPDSEDAHTSEPSMGETIGEAVDHLIDSSLILSLQDLQGIDANLALLKQQLSPIMIPHIGKR